MSNTGLNKEKIASGGTGFVALVLFVCTLFLLLYGFSAYIIRSQIDLSRATSEQSSQNDGSASLSTTTNLDKIIHTIEKFNRIESEIASTNRRISELDFSISSKESEIQSKRLEISYLNISMGDTISNLFIDLQSKLRDTDHQIPDTRIEELLQEKYNEDKDGRLLFVKTRRYLSISKNKLNNNSEAIPSFDESSRIINETFDSLSSYEEKYFTYNDEIYTKSIELTKATINKNTEKTNLEKLVAMRNNISKELPRDSESVFSSLNLLGGTLLFFIKLPTIVLTLIVTIAAGGLASLVSFTRKFLHKNDNHAGAGTLLSNVAEGIAASIGIFLFAGTGMLMLTQGSANAPTNVELSPYMVAFLAFLSGFMAESAFKRIEDAGRDFFKTKKKKQGDDHDDEGDPEGQSAAVPAGG